MKDLLQNDMIVAIAESVSYVFGAFVMFYIGKLVYDLIHKKNRCQIGIGRKG